LAAAAQPPAEKNQTLYFLERCQDGALFAGDNAGSGYLVHATEAELQTSGLDSKTLQRGERLSYTPARLVPAAPLPPSSESHRGKRAPEAILPENPQSNPTVREAPTAQRAKAPRGAKKSCGAAASARRSRVAQQDEPAKAAPPASPCFLREYVTLARIHAADGKGEWESTTLMSSSLPKAVICY
jgi:hypothetical protein